jgi:hypothetical protein
VENSGFKLPDDIRKYLLIMFAFSIVFFFIMYQRVYGGSSAKQEF